MMLIPYSRPDRLFDSTAIDYTAYRHPHPAPLVDLLMHQLRTVPCLADGTGRVLDLGSGPGTLALDMAERGLSVVAVDASTEMLAAGRRWADDRGVSGVTWRHGDAHNLHDLRDVLGRAPIGAITIGDAFHWMDRALVLDLLDQVVVSGGLIALVGSHAPGSPRAWWEPLLSRLRHRYLGDSRWAGRGVAYVEPLGGHEDVLRRSVFTQISVTTVDYRRTYTLDGLIGLQRTFAYSSPQVLSGHSDAFDHDITTALRAVQPDGDFTADLQAALIVARRPTHAG